MKKTRRTISMQISFLGVQISYLYPIYSIVINIYTYMIHSIPKCFASGSLHVSLFIAEALLMFLHTCNVSKYCRIHHNYYICLMTLIYEEHITLNTMSRAMQSIPQWQSTIVRMHNIGFSLYIDKLLDLKPLFNPHIFHSILEYPKIHCVINFIICIPSYKKQSSLRKFWYRTRLPEISQVNVTSSPVLCPQEYPYSRITSATHNSFLSFSHRLFRAKLILSSS